MADTSVVTGARSFRVTFDPLPQGNSLTIAWPGYTGAAPIAPDRLLACPLSPAPVGVSLAQNLAGIFVTIQDQKNPASLTVVAAVVSGGSGLPGDLAVALTNTGTVGASGILKATVQLLSSQAS